MRPKQNDGNGHEPTREAIAVARVIGKLAVNADDFTGPLADVLRETQAARGDKLAAFKQSAKKHELANADMLIKQASKADPNQMPEEEKALDLVTADKILSTQYPDPVWAIPDLLPVGLTILAGAPKLGKSWLALQIALAVSSGGLALGKNVRQGPVLYLALEDTERRLQSRMQKQNWTRNLPAEFMALGQFEKQIGDLKNGGGKKLANQISKRGYRLVVIDTLARSVQGDQNDVEKMTQGLTPVQEIAHAKNTAILFIDHHRKGMSESQDAIGDILGSVAKGGVSDTAWGLYRERGKTGAKLAITGRDVEERTLALSMDWMTGVWQCDGDAGEIEMTERRQEILDALDELGRPAQIKAIIELTGQTKGHTHSRLQDLVSANLVIRENRNGNIVYSLPQSKGLL